jgi:hypothetical protein
MPQFHLDKVENLGHGTNFSQAHRVDLVVRHPERDIASDCVVDKENFLWDITNCSLPRWDQFQGKRFTVNKYPTAGRPV